MTWTIELVATNIYVPTNSNCVASSTTINSLKSSNNAASVLLPIIAGDPDYSIEIDADIIANDVVTYSASRAARYTLITPPLDWDGTYYDWLTDIITRRYHYVRNVDYPNWRHSAGDYYACAIKDVSVEHKHDRGIKTIKLTIIITRR